MRRALLIATDTYLDATFAALGAPVADAQALAAVLRDRKLGDFDELVTLVNEPSYVIGERLEQVFAGAARTDTVLLYLTGHGVRDRHGNLYFAASNTRHRNLLSTAVPASLVHRVMEEGPSQQIIILDCCYSGAFVKGMLPRATRQGCVTLSSPPHPRREVRSY